MTMGIGILGFAHSHVNAYCSQWRSRPDLGVRVVAGWDHDAGRADAAGKQHETPVESTSAALLRRADVAAVVIAAETSMHADLVQQAAAAGKAIVLQKPLAITMAEADRIERAVSRAGVPFTMAWQMRVDPQNVLMKKLVDEGAIGRVYMARRRHGLPTQTWPWMENSWHADPNLNRGMWADDASHAIDFLLWLLGTPESVVAEIATLRTPKVPDDNGIAIYRYADGGPIAEVACSFTCVAGENTTEIIGEKGVIIQNHGDLPSCNVPRRKDAMGVKWYLHEHKQWISSDIAPPANHGERIAALAEPLAQFLTGNRGPIADAAEARTALAMTLASYRAAELGRRVRMAEMNT